MIRNRFLIQTKRLNTAFALAVLMPILGGCEGYPKEMAGTLTGIIEKGVLHVGIVADSRVEANERALAQEVARAAGVKVELDTGSAEVLLHQLEEGNLDLVVGEFAKASPWKDRVAFTASTEVESPPSHEPVLRAAVRSGENRWLIFVSKTLMEKDRDEGGAG